MKHTCIICDEPADRKFSTSFEQGNLFTCNKDVCKEIIVNQLKGIRNNLN
jgi:ribosomal protein S17E